MTIKAKKHKQSEGAKWFRTSTDLGKVLLNT